MARVDLKADRAARRLLVQSAWEEPTAPGDTAVQLAEELRGMAHWLDLDDVVVAPHVTLAEELAGHIAAVHPSG